MEQNSFLSNPLLDKIVSLISKKCSILFYGTGLTKCVLSVLNSLINFSRSILDVVSKEDSDRNHLRKDQLLELLTRIFTRKVTDKHLRQEMKSILLPFLSSLHLFYCVPFILLLY